MTDEEKIRLLLQRLYELQQSRIPSWQEPIRDAAREALEAEIAELGRRLDRAKRSTGRTAAPIPLRAVPQR